VACLPAAWSGARRQYVVENLSDLPYESLSVELKPAVR